MKNLSTLLQGARRTLGGCGGVFRVLMSRPLLALSNLKVPWSEHVSAGTMLLLSLRFPVQIHRKNNCSSWGDITPVDVVKLRLVWLDPDLFTARPNQLSFDHLVTTVGGS